MFKEITFHALLYIILFICQNQEATARSSELEEKETGKSRREFHFRSNPVDKAKREINQLTNRETKLNHFKRLSENFYKYRKAKSPKTLNFLLAKTWGGGGMPFNVLYTSNSHKQKFFKSEPKAEESKGRRKQVPEVYDLVLEDDKLPAKSKEKIVNKPRKYYSVIPQLFVSYGW